MTEEEWTKCCDPEVMASAIRSVDSPRKCRLFACECCRRIWHLLDPSLSGSHLDIHPRTLVEIGERYSDTLATECEWHDARSGNAIMEMWHPAGVACNAAQLAIATSDLDVALFAAKQAVRAASGQTPDDLDSDLLIDPKVEANERVSQAALLRDIFGNPFRPVKIDASWQTETVIALASGIYEDRAFERLPILADALEEAGCDNSDILTHCREPGEHVRGCWVVDLILGKS